MVQYMQNTSYDKLREGQTPVIEIDEEDRDSSDR